METGEKKLWTERGRGQALAAVLGAPYRIGLGSQEYLSIKRPLSLCRKQEDKGRRCSNGAQHPLWLEDIGRGWRRRAARGRLRDSAVGSLDR